MRKRRKTKARLLALAVTLLTLLNGCGGGSGGETDALELWFYYPTQVSGNVAVGMERIVEGFNETHSDIHVTTVYAGTYRQTAQKAMSDLAGGNGPNVILSGLLDIEDYYSVRMAEDLTDLIAQEDPSWREDFTESLWDSFVMEDGGTYGLPFQHSVCVLYYNEEMLDAAGVTVPGTWAELEEAVRTLADWNGAVVPVEFPSDVWVLEALTLSESGSLVKDAAETAFDSPEAVDALELLDRLIGSGGMIQTYAAAAEDFVAESCAMMLNTTGNLGFVSEDADFSWDVALVPMETAPGVSYGGGGLMMTAGQSEEERAASWEFMKYMTSPEVSAQWLSVSGYFPVRVSARALPEVQSYYAEHPQAARAAALLEYAVPQWSTEHYWDVYACMQTALDSVLIDRGAAPAAALEQAQREAMAILSAG